MTQDFKNTSILIGNREKINIFTRQDSLKTLWIGGNKARPTKWEQAKAIHSELAIARESVTIPMVSKTQRQAEEQDHFIMEKREGFRCALIGGGWHGDPRGGATRSAVSYVTD